MPDELEIGPSVLSPGPPKHPDRLARLLIWPLLLALVFTTVVFYVLYSPLRIVGDSMDPTLHAGERVLRTKSYPKPARRDIVIIDEGTSMREDIVKRVVGIAGDTVEIRDDVAIVNGQPEPTKDLILLRGAGEYADPVTVPAGHVYVMGDNRPISLDSRMIGPVPVGKIRGRAVFVFAPFYDVRPL